MIPPVANVEEWSEREIAAALLNSGSHNPEPLQLVVDYAIEEEMFVAAEASIRSVVRAELALLKEGEPINLITVFDWLMRNDPRPTGRWDIYLSNLILEHITIENTKSAVRVVAGAARKRKAERAARRVAALISDGATREEIAQAQREASELAAQLDAVIAPKLVSSIRPGRELLAEVAAARGGKVTYVESGLPEVDRFSLGLWNGELLIVAARPAIGKTSMATTLAHNISGRGEPVAFFSHEMTPKALMRRIAAAELDIEVNAIRAGRLTPEQFSRLEAKVLQMESLPIIWHRGNSGDVIEDIQPLMRQAVRQRGAKVIFLDYLQLLGTREKHESRTKEVERVAYRLHELAGDEGVPVVALAQINRGAENASEKRPTIAHLRESGGIENAASTIWLLHRPEHYGITEFSDGTSTEGVAEVIVAKQREGDTGTLLLHYDKKRTRFGDLIAYRDSQLAPSNLPESAWTPQQFSSEEPF